MPGRRPTPEAYHALEERTAEQQAATAEATARARALIETGDAFMRRFHTVASDATEGLRRETRRMRRRAMPWLAAALLVWGLPCVAVGALVQSHFGPLEAYDDTGGWKQFVWDRYGERIVNCSREAERGGQAIDCRLRVH